MGCNDTNTKICDIKKTLPDVKEYERRVKNKMCTISKSYVYELKNAYSTDKDCRNNKDKKLDKLNNYLDKIDELKKQMIIGSHLCLDNEGLSKFFEKIEGVIGKSCKSEFLDYIYDDSMEFKWLAENPLCVSYEEWNKWAKLKVIEWELDVTTEEHKNNLLIELYAESVDPSIMLFARVIDEVNNLDINVSSKSEEELKYELDLLVRSLPQEGNLDIQLYTKLHNNNISIDIIREIYNKGLELDVVTKEGKEIIEIITSSYSYPVSEIKTHLKVSELDDDMKNIFKELTASYNNN